MGKTSRSGLIPIDLDFKASRREFGYRVPMSANVGLTASLVLLAAVSVLLAALVLRRFHGRSSMAHFYWGLGLALVAVTLLEEAALYAGAWSQWLVGSYLVLVALLVGILSLGSAELQLAGRWRTLWSGYIVLTGALLVVVGCTTNVSPSILSHGVVAGLPPTSLVVASSLVTFPAATLLVVSSAYGAWKQRRYQLLCITAGTLVISASGALYLAAFPLSLYYAEFVGVALLFLGFIRIPSLSDLGSRTVPAD